MKKKRISPLRVLARLLCCLVLALALAFAVLMYLIPALERADETPAAGSADWMAALDDAQPLGAVVLPGTHDSATQYVQLAFFSKCQSLSIGAQLDAGFRYLDVRLAADGDRLRLMHGFTGCTTGGAPWAGALYLDEVLEQCYAFLDAHPTETVVFAVKQEHGGESAAEFETLLAAYTARRPDRWLLTDTLPAVGEARGRLVLMRRYEDAAGLGAAGGIPLLWADQGGHDDVTQHIAREAQDGYTLWVQDRYKYGDADKLAAFRAGLAAGETGADAVSLHFLSTNGTAAYGHPYAHARALDPALLATDASSLRGWIVVDFGSPALARQIRSANFA